MAITKKSNENPGLSMISNRNNGLQSTSVSSNNGPKRPRKPHSGDVEQLDVTQSKNKKTRSKSI